MTQPVQLFRGDDPKRAVAVAGGRIVAIGAEAVDLRVESVVDVGTGVLVPAFRDGHVHPLWGGQALAGAPLADATSLDDLRERVRAYATSSPDAAWITGARYDATLLPQGLGQAKLLDDVVPDRPVLLWASDHHSAWLNSVALARVGITDGTPDPRGGVIVRDAAGRATGALLEAAAHDAAAHMPAPSFEDKLGYLRVAMQQLSAAGVTWVQDASVEPENVAVYKHLAERGESRCRANLALKADPVTWRDQRDRFVNARAELSSTADVTARTVKFFADGIIETRTASLIEPYADSPGCCGEANWDSEELNEAVAAFDAEGFQVHIHAIGDAAVRAALDAVEGAARVNGQRDRRPVIAHVQLAHPDDLKRFAQLGVIANFEPLWAQPDRYITELTEPRIGPERSRLLYPIGELRRFGASVSFGSDWPVSSMRPLEGIPIAVTRQTPQGVPPGGWLPDYRLSLPDALAAYTTGVAYQAFEEDSVGRLAVGQRADLCVLEADLREVAPGDLGDLAVLGTWRDGAPVFAP